MKQIIQQKRENFHVNLRRQNLNVQLHEKRWQQLTQNKNSDVDVNNQISFEMLPDMFAKLQNDIQCNTDLNSETSLLDRISYIFAQAVQIKQRDRDQDFTILEKSHQKNLELFATFILKHPFDTKHFQSLVHMTYLFSHKLCSFIVENDLFIYIQEHYKQMIGMTGLIMSNLFVEDQTIKSIFQHKVYKHQFYNLINELCTEIPGKQLRDMIYRIGTNSYTPHSLVIECFFLLLKYSTEIPRLPEALLNANKLVEKNRQNLHKPLLQRLSELNLGSLIQDFGHTILNILLILLKYDHPPEIIDKMTTPSFLNSIEQQIKSKNMLNQIIAIQIVSLILIGGKESQAKIAGTSIMETLVKFLFLDCYKIKDEILKTLLVCLKTYSLRVQLINVGVLETIIPLLKNQEIQNKSAIYLSLKCLKQLFNDQEYLKLLKQQFKILNGPKLLEALIDVDDLAEELIEKYFND